MPSLYYNSANPRNTADTIRGLGSNTLSISAANDGIEPGVGFYVDQVYNGRPATAAFDFTDIERVEVLRGPQGTLFGKNTADGAIHVISREPTFQFESNAEVSLGDYDYMTSRGYRVLGMEPIAVGVSSDADHIITPTLAGPTAAIEQALAAAGAVPADIGSWDLHATATPGDFQEVDNLRAAA